MSAARATLPLFEAEGERVKVNPLVGWTATGVLDYIREAGLPRHPLVATGFPSIGCMPCTSAVRPGEDERAGRWRGRGKRRNGQRLHTKRAESQQGTKLQTTSTIREYSRIHCTTNDLSNGG